MMLVLLGYNALDGSLGLTKAPIKRGLMGVSAMRTILLRYDATIFNHVHCRPNRHGTNKEVDYGNERTSNWRLGYV